MAYTKKDLADLKQALADRYSNGTVPTDSPTLTRWTRFLNEGLAYCTDKLRMVKSASLTTSSGTIALPDDFITVLRVVSSEDVELAQIPQDKTDGATGYRYWIKGNHVDGFTLNTPSDDTYTVYYTFRPEEMDSDSDVCIIPDPLAVVCYAYGKIRKTESDPLEDADEALNECEQRLNEVIDQQQANAESFAFTTQPNA